MINDLLTNKSAREKADIKATEISKLDLVGEYVDATQGISVEIQSVSKINNGIELFVRAWKDGQQLGFGADGTVEIERFRIFNPPILVPDPNGGIVREWKDRDGITHTRKLREAPLEAIQQSLAHTIKLVAKDGRNVIPGKIGNTVSTFFPDANVESTSVDGRVSNDPADAGTIWATLRDAVTGTSAAPSAAEDSFFRWTMTATTDGFDIMTRSFFLFDTSTITDTDVISAATLSLFGSTITNTYTGTDEELNIYASTPASDTDLVTADYDQVGTTAFSTGIPAGSFSTTAYNDFALNASGLAAISTTGISKFGARGGVYDVPNSTPTWGSGQSQDFIGFFADQTGTTNDPKLVVTHAAPTATNNNLLLLGVG